jgi:hypothetical protein
MKKLVFVYYFPFSILVSTSKSFGELYFFYVKVEACTEATLLPTEALADLFTSAICNPYNIKIQNL